MTTPKLQAGEFTQLDLADEARKLIDADDAASQQRARLYSVIRYSITEKGMSEYRAEKITGISRPTIRKIMGK